MLEGCRGGEEIIAILVRCDDGVYTSVAVELRPETCLTDAAGLLGMARPNTTIHVQERTNGKGWRAVATGEPCPWIVAEQRAAEQAERAARFARLP